ncbi:MAG: hypothetical protein ACREC5_01010 [Thermoplasmata archaeon]
MRHRGRRVRRRGGRAAVLLGTLAALLLLLPTITPAGSAAGAPAGPRPRSTPSCGSGDLPTGLNGSLAVLGNLAPIPSAEGMGLTYSYTIETGSTTSGATTYSCGTGSVSLTTTSGGQFHATTAPLSNSCSGATCIAQTGPFYPAHLTLSGSAPSGYYLNGTVTEPFTHLALLAGFGGSRTNATGISTMAIAEEAGTADVTLTADDTHDGHAPPSRSVMVPLNASATTLSAATVTATRIDVGETTTFSLQGTGAAGYDYVATLVPGLTDATLSRPCPATAVPGGLVDLTCAFSVEYDSAGAAQPVAYLSNGYSNASRSTPAVTVSPALLLEVSPDPILVYAGDPVSVTGSVAGGTGTDPFGPVCLADGQGNLDCAPPPGPSWRFTLDYPLVGSYRAEFTVLDDAGVNATESVPVTVGTLPALGPLSAASPEPPPGAPDRLRAELSGGVAPFDYWFNDSDPSGTLLAGTFASDGEVGGNLTLTAPGVQQINLTVLDAVGTRVASQVLVEVSVGTAVDLGWASGGGPGAAFPAGRTEPFALAAYGLGGARVADFATWVNLTVLTEPFGPFYVNGSIRGPIARGPPATYSFRPGDWESGYLNFTLALFGAGRYYLDAAAPFPVAGTRNGTFGITVDPEVGALRLVDPEVALAGLRTNDTRWALVDPFGNPAPPGEVFVVEQFGSGNDTTPAPVLTNATAAFAWINYSAPNSGSGSLFVLSQYGGLLLGPLQIPAQPPTTLAGSTVALVAALLAVPIAAAVIVNRRRLRIVAPRPPPELDPEELRRQAAGRDRLLRRIRQDGPLDLEELLAGPPDARTDRAEAAEWLASLLTEGLVRSSPGPEGRPRFQAAPPAIPARPRVHLDSAALDRALRRGPSEPPAPPAPDEPEDR